MNFDDILGLLVFLGIIIISSVFRGIKEMKKKEEEGPTKSSPPPIEKKSKEFKTNIPKRKVIIRKEVEPTFPPPPPVLTPIPETVETKEDIFEKMEEGEEQITVKMNKQTVKEPYQKPTQKEKPFVFVENKDKNLIVAKSKSQKEKEGQPSIARIQKVAVSAPMERVSIASPPSSSISLKGSIGNIPKLQWAFIMMEVLSPPKALRHD